MLPIVNNDPIQALEVKTHSIQAQLTKKAPQISEKALCIYQALFQTSSESLLKTAKIGYTYSIETAKAILCKIWQAYLKAIPSLNFVKVPFADESIKQMQKKAYEALLERPNTNFITWENCYQRLYSDIRNIVVSPYQKNISSDKYKNYGAHCHSNGTEFIVDAPNAETVSVKLIGKDEREESTVSLNKMPGGEWKSFVEGIKPGQLYQLMINRETKIDPYALSQKKASDWSTPPYCIVTDRNSFSWNDSEWLQKRIHSANKPAPINIYEIHPTTWKKENGNPLNYRELAHQLKDYCKEMNYTHVELMGILEHPVEQSWGYQATGYFSPNSRMGSPEDFKYLVNYLHQNHIGVILDWVPSHFAVDRYNLDKFDGTDMFGCSKEKNEEIENKCHWGSKYFDYSKQATKDFLISSANYWIKEMHLDGLRVDAVSRIIDRDIEGHGKKFLKQLNTCLHAENRGILTIAEETDGLQETTKPLSEKGLGFDFKWNFSWMHHTLNFFQNWDRLKGYNEINQAVFTDQGHAGMMNLSHDEVADLKPPLIHKLPGMSQADKFANLRLLFGFMMCLPGKKLSFMGNEFANNEAWTSSLIKNQGLDWNETKQTDKAKLQTTIKELNAFYVNTPALWEKDTNGCIQAIFTLNKKNPVLCYRRESLRGKKYTCLHNFSTEHFSEYIVPISNKKEAIKLKEVFNSDSKRFGGQDRFNEKIELIYNRAGALTGFKIQVPPLSTVVVDETDFA